MGVVNGGGGAVNAVTSDAGAPAAACAGTWDGGATVPVTTVAPSSFTAGGRYAGVPGLGAMTTWKPTATLAALEVSSMAPAATSQSRDGRWSPLSAACVRAAVHSSSAGAMSDCMTVCVRLLTSVVAAWRRRITDWCDSPSKRPISLWDRCGLVVASSRTARRVEKGMRARGVTAPSPASIAGGVSASTAAQGSTRAVQIDPRYSRHVVQDAPTGRLSAALSCRVSPISAQGVPRQTALRPTFSTRILTPHTLSPFAGPWLSRRASPGPLPASWVRALRVRG